MNDQVNRKLKQRGGILAMVTLMVPLFMIPLMGLAIDGTMLFIIHAKLSAAVDGAALGAGRLLGTNANSDEIAGEFLRANFPAGFWGTTNLTPTISTTRALGTYTINVSANVRAPLLFMRILGSNYSLVAASATATRKDTRLVLVLDRSESLNANDPVTGQNAFAVMKDSAKEFVGMFTPGTDELGLVVFSGTGVVAYPTARPYNASPTSAGGPDTGFGTSATAGTMITQINNTDHGGATNISDALSLAYIELQKAHNRAISTYGLDNSLNAIVLFTDGAPTALSIYANNPAGTAIKASSPCTYKTATASASTRMIGNLTTSGSGPSSYTGTPRALRRLASLDTAHTLDWWLLNPDLDTGFSADADPTVAMKNCSGLVPSAFGITDLAKIPDVDYYGNSTGGAAYMLSSDVYNGNAYNNTGVSSGYNIGIAGWNATDNVGRTIRTQTAMNPIAIYTIGYFGANGNPDSVLLKRLANTLDASGYSATQQSGLYLEVHSSDQMAAAFSSVASDLLRLAR